MIAEAKRADPHFFRFGLFGLVDRLAQVAEQVHAGCLRRVTGHRHVGADTLNPLHTLARSCDASLTFIERVEAAHLVVHRRVRRCDVRA
ncbi:hypothetical protein [Burkholderia vietnamiensis]|uniref:hypothetical protein n=1 Tax=Burkholderia vietnamiensis TaxID=60552 RepID=UPI001CF160A5|nr:hypothetical protein [Burkholderia vietnamiensis]